MLVIGIIQVFVEIHKQYGLWKSIYLTQRIDNPRQKAEAAMQFLTKIPTPKEMPGDPSTILAQRLRHKLENMDEPLTYLVHESSFDRLD